jgi:hypothetical protein
VQSHQAFDNNVLITNVIFFPWVKGGSLITLPSSNVPLRPSSYPIQSGPVDMMLVVRGQWRWCNNAWAGSTCSVPLEDGLHTALIVKAIIIYGRKQREEVDRWLFASQSL